MTIPDAYQRIKMIGGPFQVLAWRNQNYRNNYLQVKLRFLADFSGPQADRELDDFDRLIGVYTPDIEFIQFEEDCIYGCESLKESERYAGRETA